MNSLNQFSDQFDKLIADHTKNKGALNAGKKYDPYRWRVHYNGSRRYIRYGDNANFTDAADYYNLAPASGDTMMMRTAQLFQYVPQYILRPSFACKINQSLQTGDKVTIAYGEADLNNSMASASGWIVELVPSLDDNECYFSIYRDGTIVSNGGNRLKVSLSEPLTGQRRFALDLNWYNVGSAILRETFTDQNGHQVNINHAEIGAYRQKGPKTSTQPVEFSITSGGNGTEFQVGSTACILLGDPKKKVRVKRALPTVSVTTTGSYEPLIAFRNRNREIDVSIVRSAIFEYTADDDIDMLTAIFGSDKVTFTGNDSWSTPEGLDEFETAVDLRTDIDQFADLDGNLGGGNGVGGSQKFLDRQTSSGTGSNVQTEGVDAAKVRDNLYYNDIAVIFGKSGTTGDLTFIFDYEEK